MEMQENQNTSMSGSELPSADKVNKAYPVEAPMEEYLNRIGYFTPSIEDIRVGYILEWLEDPTTNSWKTLDLTGNILTGFIHSGIQPSHVRVPYLTKEQIEKEGWTPNQYGWTKDKFDMTYRLENHRLEIGHDCGEYLNCGDFAGECKDINTFRYICKLLGI